MSGLDAKAHTPLATLMHSFNANAAGEIKGISHPWACQDYGTYGHNYITCRTCLANFMARQDAKEAA